MSTQTQMVSNDAGDKPLKAGTNEAVNGSLTSATMRSPDPSVHKTKNTTLQDQASAAALYSTNHSAKGTGRRDINPLGHDGKLSSASAATSLKQAKAQDLFSFPVVGIDTRSSAGTAATLAHANKESLEWWKPEHSAAAGKAALLANDLKMAPFWQPEASTAGSKAALLAHKNGVKSNTWSPEASAAGNSAATLAFKKQGLGPKLDSGQAEDGKRGALVAATGAVSSCRKRAQSSPAPPPLYPDSENSAKNALSAATIAHTPSMKVAKTPLSPHTIDSNRVGSEAMEAARIQHSKSISRQMYTEHPPVALKVGEQNRQNALRASAISMAKQMYDIQQKHIDGAAGRLSRSHARTGASTAHGQQQEYNREADIKRQAMGYIGIQEAAQKLAAERLAKIGTDEDAAFRSYYGYETPHRSKLTIRRGRGRASSNPETADLGDSDDDELRCRRVRSQMSQFNKTLAEVDAKKREQDRKNLLAAAERKVQAQMQGIDKKIFEETGKMSPAMIEEWDAKARAKAAASSEARMENHGKVHIGHGKFVDQADIDAVAAARIQPTLDEITEKTEKRKAEEEEMRLDQEEKKRQALMEKERAAELKAEEKRTKDEEKKAAKARTSEEKAAVKQEKEAEKAKKAEEKRMQKEEKRKSKEAANAEAAVVADAAALTTDTTPATQAQDDELYRAPEPLPQHPPQTSEPETSNPASPTSPTSPSKSDRGFKSVLNRLKRRSRHSATTAGTDRPGFIGGAALRTSSPFSNPISQSRSPVPGPTGPTQPSEHPRYSDVSSLSSGLAISDDRSRYPQRTTNRLSAVSGGTEFEEARDEFDEKLVPPPSFASADISGARKGNPNRDSRFHEVGI
ncbi:hypothetical protein K469DRAFT_708272 [Zopfia rhizophila CBS 207.26]|uniref:Eisosome protein 1 n=1 Tax=Zopfia rhizophila CBS 207.26 TaxID=1314779 RepID=A0A6A6E2R9_9PEZI|nr:hypothetical protein K469DRAFT_708272 [Zopfia rhizophila CBS 207.26]